MSTVGTAQVSLTRIQNKQDSGSRKSPLLDFFYRTVPILSILEQFDSKPEIPTFVYIGILITWMQQLGFIFNTNFSAYWGYILGGDVSRVFYSMHFPLWDTTFVKGATIATSHGLLWTLVAVTLSACLLLVYFKIGVDGSEKHSHIFVAIQRMCSRALSTIMLIPILHALFSVMVCDASGHMWLYGRKEECWTSGHSTLFAFALLCTFILGLTAFVCSTSDYIDAPLHLHPKARAHGYVDTIYFFFTFFTVMLFHVLMAYSSAQVFVSIFFACQLLLAGGFAFIKPFFNEDINAVHVSMHLTTAFCSLILAITMSYPNIALSNLSSVIALGAFPVVTLFGVLLSEFRVSAAFKRALWLTSVAVNQKIPTDELEDMQMACMDDRLDVASLPFAKGLVHDRWSVHKDIATVILQQEAADQMMAGLLEDELPLPKPEGVTKSPGGLTADALGLNDKQDPPSYSRASTEKKTKNPVPPIIAPFLDAVYSVLDVELVNRFLLHFSRKFNVVATPRMIAYGAKAYAAGLVTYQTYTIPAQFFGNFIWQFHPSMAQTGLDELKRYETMGGTVSELYHCFLTVQKLKYALGIRSKNNSLLFALTEAYHIRTLMSISNFWMKLTETSVDLRELSEIASTVTKGREDTIASFRRTIQNQTANDISLISRLSVFVEEVLLDAEGAAVCKSEIRDIQDARTQRHKRGAKKTSTTEIDPETLSNRLLQVISGQSRTGTEDGSQARRGARVLIGQTLFIALCLLTVLSITLGLSSVRATENTNALNRLNDGGSLRYLSLRFAGTLYNWELESANQTKKEELYQELVKVADRFSLRFSQVAHGEAKTEDGDHNFFFSSKTFVAYGFDGTPSTVSPWDLAERINSAQKVIVADRVPYSSESLSIKQNAPIFGRAFNQSVDLYLATIDRQATAAIRDNCILFGLAFVLLGLMYRTIVLNFRWIAQSRVFVFQLFTLIPYDDVEQLASDAKSKAHILLKEKKEREEKEKKKEDPLQGDDEKLADPGASAGGEGAAPTDNSNEALQAQLGASDSGAPSSEKRKDSRASSLDANPRKPSEHARLPRWMISVGFSEQTFDPSNRKEESSPLLKKKESKMPTAEANVMASSMIPSSTTAGGPALGSGGDGAPVNGFMQLSLQLRSCIRGRPASSGPKASKTGDGVKPKVTVTNNVYVVHAAKDGDEDDEAARTEKMNARKEADTDLEDLEEDGGTAKPKKRRSGAMTSLFGSIGLKAGYFALLLIVAGLCIGLFVTSVIEEDPDEFSTTVDNEQLQFVQMIRLSASRIDSAALRTVHLPSADTFEELLDELRHSDTEKVIADLSRSRSEEIAELSARVLSAISLVRDEGLDSLLLISEAHPEFLTPNLLTEIRHRGITHPSSTIITKYEDALPTNAASTMTTAEIKVFLAAYIIDEKMAEAVGTLLDVLDEISASIRSRYVSHNTVPTAQYILAGTLIGLSALGALLRIWKTESVGKLYGDIFTYVCLTVFVLACVIIGITRQFEVAREHLLKEQELYDKDFEKTLIDQKDISESSISFKIFAVTGKVTYWYRGEQLMDELTEKTFELSAINQFSDAMAARIQKLTLLNDVSSALTMRSINGTTLIEADMQEKFDGSFWLLKKEDDYESEISSFANEGLYNSSEFDLKYLSKKELKQLAINTVMNKRYEYHLGLATNDLNDLVAASLFEDRAKVNSAKSEYNAIYITMIVLSGLLLLIALVLLLLLIEPFGELTGSGGMVASTGAAAAAENLSTHVTLLSRARITLVVLTTIGIVALIFGILPPATLTPLYGNMNLASERDFALATTYFHSFELLAKEQSPLFYSHDPMDSIVLSNNELQRVTSALYSGKDLSDGKLATLGQDPEFDYLLFSGTDWQYRQTISDAYKETQCTSVHTVDINPIEPGPFGTSTTPLGEVSRLWSTLSQELGDTSSTIVSEAKAQMESIQITMFDSFEFSTKAYGSYIENRRGSFRLVFETLTIVMIAGLVIAAVGVFLPMVIALVEDEAAIWSLISMIPAGVREKVPAIADFIETGRADSAAELQRKVEVSENLLKNILPTKIANRLKSGEQPIADKHAAVTMCFTDLVGFTAVSSQMNADEIVSFLNELFIEFDTIAELFEVEKVKTIGDAYFMVGGLDERQTDHALRVVEASLCFFDSLEEHNDRHPDRKALRMRLGVHTGSVVAGVIGTKKVAYDLWGRSVEIANSMESSGVPGKVHASESTVREIHKFFTCDPRGPLPTEKGMPDNMPKTFVVEGRTNASPYQHLRRPKMAKNMYTTANNGATTPTSLAANAGPPSMAPAPGATAGGDQPQQPTARSEVPSN